MNDKLIFSDDELVTILTMLRCVEYSDGDEIVEKIMKYFEEKEND